MIVRCPCGRHFTDETGVRRLCHQCRNKARKDNLCTACGLKPMTDAGTCDDCAPKIREWYRQVEAKKVPTANDFHPKKLRGQDYRENIRETKFGRDG